ncbi:hypothetical protein [Flavobacterium sp.]|jgi:hypothetical protein|uniref:hypothetical protein n=1 Tax=Flavobacterium sp. TaxID=239 RepID=UPI0037C0B8FA
MDIKTIDPVDLFIQTYIQLRVETDEDPPSKEILRYIRESITTKRFAKIFYELSQPEVLEKQTSEVMEPLTDAQLTLIYKQANGEALGKAAPLTSQKIFTAMRAMVKVFPNPPTKKD